MTWMNPEDTVLSESSQAQKTKYYDSTDVRYPSCQIHTAERWLQGLGEDGGVSLFNGRRVSVLQDKKFWRRKVMMAA